MNREIELLLRILDEAYERQSWHGPNLRGSLRGVTADKAAWRPAPDAHNIWELALHAAYWKYAVRRRLRGDKRASFPLRGSNWFPRPETVTESAWRDDLQLLKDEHLKLREAIAGLAPELLDQPAPGGKIKYARLIYGIAAHDIYHAGQIQLLKRLAGA